MDNEKQSVEFMESLEDLQHSFDCGIQMVSAVRECMEDGKSSADTYSDALYGAVEYLQGISDKLQKMMEGIQ